MAWTVDKAHTGIEFSARHLAVTTVKGRFETFDASIDVQNGVPVSASASVDAASISTREPQRDGHLKSADFLDVENHPKITFKSTRIQASNGQFTMEGDLTIRGTTRPVTLKGEHTPIFKDHTGANRIAFSAEGKINRKEWGLNWNAVLEAGRLLVGEDVKLIIELEATEA